MKTTSHIFGVIARVIPKISLENFTKAYRTFLQKQRKILKMCLLSPQKIKTQNNPKQTVIPPIKFFILKTMRVLSRIYVQNFMRNQTVFKKQRKIPQIRPKKYPKMERRGKENLLYKLFQCIKYWSNTKNIFANLYEKRLNSSQ